MMRAKRKYFGTDGVRGKVGEAPITPEFALSLGYAAGRILAAQANLPGERPAVLIGKDTRVSGYLLEAALESGFAAAGVDVSLVGPLPTPGVAYLTRALRLQAGVVISASHNPYDDNGIKFFSSSGMKLPDEVELAIEAELEKPMGCVASADLGRAHRIDDARGRYIEFCKSAFPSDLNLRGLKLVVDCAHGAAYHVAPDVFHELGAEVIPIGCAPDGLNINAGFGATAPQALREAVREHHAHLGVALDGDGDRLLMTGPGGEIYDGDQLLYVIAQNRLSHGQPVAGVAGTLMSNLALERALARLGVPFERARVGDRYVVEKLLEKGWLLGGENSGHLLCLDKHSTGDGIIAALQVLAALRQQDAEPETLLGALKLYPQTLINVPLLKGASWRENLALAAAHAKAEAALQGEGRVLLRASGTEAKLRVMVEGRDAGNVRQQAEWLAGEARRILQDAAKISDSPSGLSV
ncbi:MAG: phosphoglucosamine mutase [Zoogloeaceae bacterium]|jgi:phosphoglucosamine mutase|nr:phosphoglucosamine mutase [Zoogloeaceae bacterium]